MEIKFKKLFFDIFYNYLKHIGNKYFNTMM